MKRNNSNTLKTLLTISVGFIFIYLITKWNWTILVSFVIGLIGIFSTYLSKKIEYIWMKLSWILSFIIPNILLGTIFYLFLFPISVLAKLFGHKDPLLLKRKYNSTFRNCSKQFDKNTFENPW
jgi:hypothetical protein